MKTYLLLFTILLLSMTACKKDHISHEEHMMGNWVIDKATRTKGFNTQNLTASFDNTFITFQENNIAKATFNSTEYQGSWQLLDNDQSVSDADACAPVTEHILNFSMPDLPSMKNFDESNMDFSNKYSTITLYFETENNELFKYVLKKTIPNKMN